MIWDGNGYPVVRGRGCCAACVRGAKAFGETSCGKPSCGCHVETAIGSGRDSLGAQAAQNGSGVLGDRSDGSTSQAGVQQNQISRRE